jgi:hypothetical protein
MSALDIHPIPPLKPPKRQDIISWLYRFDIVHDTPSSPHRFVEDCIYQHPDRWGADTEYRFSMLHDIYSLGVVLLEIGLWKPFVRWRIGGERYICWSVLNGHLIENRELREGKTPSDVRERY